jgi:predicted ATPase/DNA-binding SARP family transcriptional activator
MAAQQDLRFCVLGPLEVVVAGRPLALSGKLRSLLAILLLNKNQVVSRSRLLEELWPGAAEDRAAHRLDVHVSKLRRALGGAGGRLLSRSGGYMLEVSPDELDLERFERLVAEGRRALSAGDAAQAASTLCAALSLWRGAPLADVELNGGGAGVALEESRLAALEDRIEAELALGHHAELVGELTDLVAGHPLRERLRGQLMLCLYRSGRQAEALELYRETRERFASELGIEPSRSLKELERAILRQEASLEPPQQSAPRAHAPAPLTSFVGRGQELAELRELILRREVRVVTLTGAGGIGKTRLALSAAEELAADYPDGIFFIDLAPLRDHALVIDSIAHGLEAKDDLAGHIGDSYVLLVLDNFEHVLEAAAEVAELLRACRNLNVLATSRERLRLSGEHLIEVPPLRESEAVALFRERARAVGRDFQANGEVAEICRRLDGLPLAIELAAARVAEPRPQALLQELETRLPVLTEGPRDLPARHQTLRAAIDWSYELLPEDEQQLLARLSVFAGGCTLEAAEEVAGAEPSALESIVAKSLLRHTDDRFWMLETIREYALERLEASGERMRERHAAFFLKLAEAAAPHLKTSCQDEWFERLAAEYANLRAALLWLAESGDGTSLVRLATSLATFWRARGHVREGREWLERAVETGAGTPSQRLRALEDLGQFVRLGGDLPRFRALTDELLVLGRELGDAQAIASGVMRLAFLSGEEGRFEDARRLYAESALWFEAASDARGLNVSLWNLGVLEFRAGRFADAAQHTRRALEFHRSQGDTLGVGMLLANLACELERLGRADEALAAIEEGLEICATRSGVELLVTFVEALAGLLRKRPAESARFLGAVEGLCELSGLTLNPVEARMHEAILADLREELSAPELEAARSAGSALDFDEALDLARAAVQELAAEAAARL